MSIFHEDPLTKKIAMLCNLHLYPALIQKTRSYKHKYSRVKDSFLSIIMFCLDFDVTTRVFIAVLQVCHILLLVDFKRSRSNT